LPISLQEAWDFFSVPGNLDRITPDDMSFEILSGAKEPTFAGQIITYRIRPFLGIPMNWVTEITQAVAGSHFIDEQRFGPYRFWHHLHRFTEKDGGRIALCIARWCHWRAFWLPHTPKGQGYF
jgi:ligand-binding SRPBCC domain-containing protein